MAEYFEKAFTAGGGKIVGKETYTAKDTDFSAILAKVAAAKPDMIYLPDYYNVVNLATKQAKEKGIKALFMGGDGWDSSDLDLKAADGGFFTNHYSPDDTRPEVQNFVKAFGAKYKDDKGQPKVPDALAALAYDATNMLLQAIKDAGADDTAKVKDAMDEDQLQRRLRQDHLRPKPQPRQVGHHSGRQGRQGSVQLRGESVNPFPGSHPGWSNFSTPDGHYSRATSLIQYRRSSLTPVAHRGPGWQSFLSMALSHSELQRSRRAGARTGCTNTALKGRGFSPAVRTSKNAGFSP